MWAEWRIQRCCLTLIFPRPGVVLHHRRTCQGRQPQTAPVTIKHKECHVTRQVYRLVRAEICSVTQSLLTRTSPPLAFQMEHLQESTIRKKKDATKKGTFFFTFSPPNMTTVMLMNSVQATVLKTSRLSLAIISLTHAEAPKRYVTHIYLHHHVWMNDDMNGKNERMN